MHIRYSIPIAIRSADSGAVVRPDSRRTGPRWMGQREKAQQARYRAT
jgi:hypothetical protein